MFCVLTYIAVIALFCLTGTATAIPMTTLPRRFLRDVRLLVTRPVALLVAILFLGASATAIFLLPARLQRRGRRSRPTARQAAQPGRTIGFRALLGRATARDRAGVAGGRLRADRQVHRFLLPGVRIELFHDAADPGQVPGRAAGRREVDLEGVPIGPVVQPALATGAPGRVCRGGRDGAGRRAPSRCRNGAVAVLEPGGSDP